MLQLEYPNPSGAPSDGLCLKMGTIWSDCRKKIYLLNQLKGGEGVWFVKQDEQRAHSVIGRITKLTFDHGQDPITFTERLEGLFFEHNAYAKSHMSEDSLVRHLLEAVKPNSSLEMWARERLRQSSSYEWDGLKSEFIELAKDLSNRVPHIAVVANRKGTRNDRTSAHYQPTPTSHPNNGRRGDYCPD